MSRDAWVVLGVVVVLLVLAGLYAYYRVRSNWFASTALDLYRRFS